MMDLGALAELLREDGAQAPAGALSTPQAPAQSATIVQAGVAVAAAPTPPSLSLRAQDIWAPSELQPASQLVATAPDGRKRPECVRVGEFNARRLFIILLQV